MKIIILIIAILVTLIWSYMVRDKTRREQKIEKANELIAFLFTISVIYIIWSNVSPYHLLWMFPLSFILGMLSMTSPLRILWIFSSLYFKLWYIGVFNLGRSYYLNKEYDKALEVFEEELKNNKKSSELYFNLALTYGKLGLSDKEITSYEESIKLNNKIPQTYFNLGNAYEESGDIQNAIINMKNALSLDSSYEKALYSISLLYNKINDKTKMMEYYEKLKKTNLLMSEKLIKEIS